ncbi:MAG: hypothetical protein CSA22_09310 [Deltaproteobacteria bacterium]|nr:MAG: hypothetical protein CSA22_09310 [Deltaproteobacteria bacterium]
MKPEERKEQILNCAKKLFSKNGFYKTQIADIVNSSKIARGTIYHYFSNKDDIFITLLERYCRQWEAAIAIRTEDIDLFTVTPKEYLLHRIRNVFRFFSEDPHISMIVLRVGAGLPGDLETSIKQFETIITQIIMNDLKLGIRHGSVKPDIDIEMVANLIAGGLFRTAYLYFGPHRKAAQKVDIEVLTRDVADFLVGGVFVSG